MNYKEEIDEVSEAGGTQDLDHQSTDPRSNDNSDNGPAGIENFEDVHLSDRK